MWSNLPNFLTLLRIFSILPLCVLVFLPGTLTAWLAFIIYLLASITDFFDGWLARKMNLESRFGGVMDPVADKMLITSIVIILIATQTITGISIFIALIILLREIFISGLRDMMAQDSISLPVSSLAKKKTACQMAALTMLLFFHSSSPSYLWQGMDDFSFSVIFNQIGLILLWGAALLSVISAWDYAKKIWKNL